MRHKALAKKCRNQSRGGTRKSPRRFHRRYTVLKPTVAIVNRPTHLQLATAPSERPESVSHNHQERVKAWCLSSLQKPHQRNVVSAVKKTSGESRRMCRDWVTRPFSKVTKREAKRAVVARQSSARRVRYASGTVATPSVAGTIRIATYGTFSYGLKHIRLVFATKDGTKHVLCNVLEVKLAVVPKDKCRQCDKQLCEWWVHIHKILRLYISRSKLSKVHFVETWWVKEISNPPKLTSPQTHTTLLGCDILNNRTADASRTIKNNNFHSPDVMFSPPGG